MPEDLQFLALDGPAARSAADALAALLAGESNSLTSEYAPIGGQTECAVLVLTCMDAVDQIRALPAFRGRGFRGPVLIVSGERFDELKQSHRILRWAHGARDVFGPAWLLPDLLERASQLRPLGEATLWHLQQLLLQSSSEWDEKFSRCLRIMAAGEVPLQESVGGLERVLVICARQLQWLRIMRGPCSGAVLRTSAETDRIDDHHLEVLNSLVRRAMERLRETSENL